ncbi:MAG: cytoplasmic protein [Candidatus Hydrogenedentes bacterium]|nr:cytoplasmic protein [Candidatus Hydrogenedentota bacterium]
METKNLEHEIARCLENFYSRRLQGLEKLSLRRILSKKNPYLYRALGVEKASDIVEQNLVAFVISSDETKFGDCFCEPLARLASGGKVSDAEGVDFTVEFADRYLAVAVKSGPAWGNRDQHKRQSTNFDSLRSRLYKIQKKFDPLVGQAYGRQSSESTENSRFRRRSGQAFWQELTGDPDFYLKLIRLMKDVPAKNRSKYRALWDQAVNRFTAEFVRDFCDSNGAIDWEKLVAFASGTERPKFPKVRRTSDSSNQT